MKKAVILLSGGLDSTTCISYAIKNGYEVYPISFDYGQRLNRELECAKKVVKHFNVKTHKIIKMDNVGGSALTDMNISVPKFEGDGEIPVTYVPARNIIFLSYATGYAEVVGADAIFIGVNAVDYSGYPDCRKEFIEAFQNMINVGTKRGVEGNPIKIETPLLNLSKGEIVKLAKEVGAPLQYSTSCYNGKEKACGVCDSCTLRLRGFKEAGLIDPIPYENDVNLK
ncbi:MAG: 7-cyano-7-deazaguanine synthase QueC [Clostridiales bacterium]|nr:7-cyano-7-deazaguanine synthase QueC [Clostridiales bacterium]